MFGGPHGVEVLPTLPVPSVHHPAFELSNRRIPLMPSTLRGNQPDAKLLAITEHFETTVSRGGVATVQVRTSPTLSGCRKISAGRSLGRLVVVPGT